MVTIEIQTNDVHFGVSSLGEKGIDQREREGIGVSFVLYWSSA